MYRVIRQFGPDQKPIYGIVTEKVIASGMTYEFAQQMVTFLNHQPEPKTPTHLNPDQQVIQDVINRKLDQFMGAGCGAQATDPRHPFRLGSAVPIYYSDCPCEPCQTHFAAHDRKKS